jgi:arylsulfatase A
MVRDISRSILGLALCIIAAAPIAQTADGDIEDKSGVRPNIIHVMADDMGYGDLGSFGQKLIPTPHLDHLAAEGMRFTQHYGGGAVCSPSRYALFTGLHSGTTGVTDNGGVILPEDAVTLAHVIQAAGYRTAFLGKWTLGGTGSSGYPLKQGFDYFFGYTRGGDSHNYYPESLVEGNTPVRLKGNQDSQDPRIAAKNVTYAPAVIQQRALDFIRSNKGQPFYLHLDYNLPHINNELHKRDGNGFEFPGKGRFVDEDWSEPDKGYAELVAIIDDYVAELVELLKETGLEKNTLFIFTSDNGPTGVRGLGSIKHFDSTGGLRGMKGKVFEGGIRIPMIAWWPGTVPAGTSTDTATTFWDILPTFAELSASPLDYQTDGLSLVRLLQGENDLPRERLLFWRQSDRLAVRLGDWKWVRLNIDSKRQQDLLFNIADDREEQHDLSQVAPDQMKRLQEAAKNYLHSPTSG